MIKRIVLLTIASLCLFMTMSCEKDKPPVVDNNFFYRVDVIGEALTNEKVELALFEKNNSFADGNPYDYDYAKVLASITSPNGEKINVLAFWYQDYEINYLNTTSKPSGISGVASESKDEPQGNEVVTPVGDPHYRVRFMPTVEGVYKITLLVLKNGVVVGTNSVKEFTVSKGTKEYKGILEVDKTNNRTFKFRETDKSFVSVGQNTGWYTSSTRKTKDYEVWFQKMNEANMNTTRTWLATWGFSLHSGKSYNDFSSRFASAARLDYYVELCEKYDMYFMLTLDNHGQFSSTVNPEWDKNPYNKKNGGILDYAYEFFTKEQAKQAYKSELLYIISRYGYSDNIFSYELFNEVDYVDGYTTLSLKVKQWHKEMALFIKENDPYHHMVSTSYRGADGAGNNLEELDFVSPHDYSYSNKKWIENIARTQYNLNYKYNKPVFFGEIGFSGENGNQTYQQDKDGTSLHQGQWAGIMSGAGGAMNWWWDSYVHPYNLYDKFTGAGQFAKLMDLRGEFKYLTENESKVSNSNLGILGYQFNDRIYGYLYDKSWSHNNKNIANKNNVTFTSSLDNGTYVVLVYNTNTMELIKSMDVTVTNNSVSVSFDTVYDDLAFIVNKK